MQVEALVIASRRMPPTSISICITKHNVFKTVRALPTLWTWEARAYTTFLGLKFLRWKAWLFLVLYSHLALDLVRSLRSVSNCWEKSRKKTKNVCGQVKMEKNYLIKWPCVRHRRTVQPISQESLAIFPALVVVSGKRKIENRGSRIKSPYLFYYFLNRKKDNSGTKGTKKMRNNWKQKHTQTTSKDTWKAHDLKAVTSTPKHLLVSEAVSTLSPPQKLPLGIPMKIAIIEK